MKPLMSLIALALFTQASEAQPLVDSHFKSGGCFVREYSTDHLAKHPDQLVKYISLSISPLDAPDGIELLNLMVNLRGKSEFLHGLAYCESQGDILACNIEGDGGAFRLEGAKNGALRLSVSDQGISFEGQTEFVTLNGNSGDDRVFLIPSVKSDLCN